MRKIYGEKTANYPRLETDRFFVDYENQLQFHGFVDEYIRYIEDFQLMDEKLWARFVKQFGDHTDEDDLWRGEFWGKMMRGACFTYSYTKNPKLYQILTKTISDMMKTQEENGRISTYPQDKEFNAWDIWCRKYVLLGMEYYLEICTEQEFSEKIIDCMCRQADYIIARIGSEGEGKKPITKATKNWRGVNSASVLEPMVRLYSLTKEKKYLDFSTYIIGTGATDVVNIFDLAYRNQLYPYQYPVTKAYEMMSCFEGALEYFRITKEEKYKIAVINFANKILESDFTIIGSCGCTHELFDHSTVRQANTTNEVIAQETCVTVTLMKFFYQLMLLTGDAKYADAFERSLYNGYFGSVNTEKIIDDFIKDQHPECIHEPMPFDSYSPLTSGVRGRRIGGLNVMPDQHYYGCCACIGSAGSGLISKVALCSANDGFVMNLFINGKIESTTPQGQKVIFETETEYPKTGLIRVRIQLGKEEHFTLLVRNPEWSEDSKLLLNGQIKESEKGYYSLEREWKDGDEIVLELDMRTKVIRPIPYGHQLIMNEVVWDLDYTIAVYDEEDKLAKKHVALQRGPVILAQENRLGYNVDDPVEIEIGEDGYVNARFPEKEIAPYKHVVEMEVPLTDGTKMHVTDYGSTGKLWSKESKMAAWIFTK